MPRRKWRPPSSASLLEHRQLYPCPVECPAHGRMMELFGLLTYDIVNEVRAGKRKVPLARQMVNGVQMRVLIADFLSHVRDAIRLGRISEWPDLDHEYTTDAAGFMGLSLGCLTDLCFNMEYVRRITDSRWAYCNKGNHPRVFYPYLGVCPRCVSHTSLREAALGFHGGDDEEETESRARYFGNKVKGHHVGRIGERVITFIIDLISKAYDREAVSGLVIDDQHDVDSVFLFENIVTLAQIKASPLIILPIVVTLPEELTDGTSSETGLPLPRTNHTFLGISTAGSDLALYFSLDDSTINLGSKANDDFPYASFRNQLTLEVVMKIIQNWITIYRAFEIPKTLRTGDNIRKAYLTSGWGDPIDDNKTKAGLARSDNMMKGTYACLKYGAYYGQECMRGTVRAALIANIDPAHQYAEYLEKLEDVRWGHDKDFEQLPDGETGGISRHIIDTANLTYLFDSVFTFNRQILNDADTRKAWNLSDFAQKLCSGAIDDLLNEWRLHQVN